MSDRFLMIVLIAVAVGATLYVLRDRIPTPNVSRDRPFVASNKQRVYPAPQDPARFEVLSQPGAAGPQYFCAAAEYARKVLRAEMDDALVTLTPEGPSEVSTRHRGVQFELRPAAEAPPPDNALVLNLRNAGLSRRVAVALRHCR